MVHIKSLAITRRNIDEWIQLWPLTFDPRLLSLDIRGPESVPPQLSHSSALFIHHLMYSSPLINLHLQNIQFPDSDRDMIVECIDDSILATIANSSFCRSILEKDVAAMLFAGLVVPESIVLTEEIEFPDTQTHGYIQSTSHPPLDTLVHADIHLPLPTSDGLLSL